MKRTVSLTIVVVMLISALTGMTAFATESADRWGTDVSDNWYSLNAHNVKKTTITNEEFDTAFEFNTYGELKDGTWERFSGDAEADDSNVAIANGKVVINPNGTAAAGVRFNFPAKQGDNIFVITAKRTEDVADGADQGNWLRASVYFNSEKKYTYKSTAEEGNWEFMAMTSSDDVSTIYLKTTTAEGASFPFSSLDANGNLNSGKDSTKVVEDLTADANMWDSIELFSVGDSFEIESVKVINYGPIGPVYIDEDFENINEADVSADLLSRSFTYAGNPLSVGETDGTVRVGDGGYLVKNFSDTASYRYYVKARVKLAEDAATESLIEIDYIDQWGGPRRYYMYNTHCNYGVDETTKYADGEAIAVKDKWTTMKIYVNNDGSPSLYIKRDGETEYKLLHQLMNNYGPNEGVSNNRVVFYGDIVLDSLEVFEPGAHFISKDITVDESGISGELKLIGEVTDPDVLPLKITGILAIYGENDTFIYALPVTKTVAEIFNGDGSVEVNITDVPEGAISAKFFLWDDMSGLKPYCEPVKECL